MLMVMTIKNTCAEVPKTLHTIISRNLKKNKFNGYNAQ